MADKEKELEEFLMNLGDEDAIYRTSLVNSPATQKLFAIFSSQEKNKNLDFKIMPPSPENEQVVGKEGDKFNRIISGVWFMPDTDYLRFDWITGEFFTTRMERSELKKAVEQFVLSANVNTFDTHHDTRPVDGLQTVEIWVLNDHKELSPILKNSIETLGYDKKDIPLGTVFMSVYVRDEAFFKDKILTGEVKGFSIEGMFTLTKKQKENMSKIKEMFAALGLIQEIGVLVLADNSQLKFTKDGVFSGDKVAANGDYKTKQGFQIVVRDGKVADFGFEEVPAAAVVAPVVTPVVEAPKVETPVKTTEQIVEEKVAAHLKKIADDKAAADAAKAVKDAEIAAQNKVVSDLQKELDDAKSKIKIPKTPIAVTDYNKETHYQKTVGGVVHTLKKK